MDNRLINKPKEEKREEEMMGFFPNDLSKIIQAYLSDDKPIAEEKWTSFTSAELASLTFSSFFDKPSLLYAHRAAYYALWGQPDQFESIVKFCPEVLWTKVKIQGPHVEQKKPHGNIIKATPYQLL